MRHIYTITTVLIIALLTSCAPKKEIQRVEATQQTDLSGRWNDTDSRLVAESLTNQLISANWINRFKQNNSDTRPIVIVGLVRNKSHEHIDANTFIKNIETAIVNDGSTRLVQAGDKREELRRERAEQQDFASMETAKNWGMELGADYMLQGTISSIVDVAKREKTVFYQINLELAHLETNEIVWIGEKKIKKIVKN